MVACGNFKWRLGISQDLVFSEYEIAYDFARKRMSYATSESKVVCILVMARSYVTPESKFICDLWSQSSETFDSKVMCDLRIQVAYKGNCCIDFVCRGRIELIGLDMVSSVELDT